MRVENNGSDKKLDGVNGTNPRAGAAHRSDFWVERPYLRCRGLDWAASSVLTLILLHHLDCTEQNQHLDFKLRHILTMIFSTF